MTIGPELWRRVETRGQDTEFEYMVWTDDNSLNGDTHWFDNEDEAREYLDMIISAKRFASPVPEEGK